MSEPISVDELEDKLRAMGWTDEHLERFAETLATLLIASGIEPGQSPDTFAVKD